MLKDAIKICPQDAIEKPQMANGEENSFRTDVKNVLTFALADRLGTTAQNINTQTPIARYGIDSLAAVEIAHTVESMCDVKLSFEMLLEGLSIEEIAISLEPPTYSRPIRSLPPVELSGDADWELSPGQEALWHIHRQAPLSSAYNIATAMRIRSSLDKDLLQKCLDTLVERHALLRATFSQSGGRTFQHIHKTMNVAFQTEDASAWSERAGKDHVAEEAERPFDLERGPLVKVHLWTYGADDHLLLIVVHHIIADLWSLAMLLRELFTLYEHRRRLTLPASPVQYSSYIEWQRNMLDAPEGNEHWNYWRNQLQDSFSVLDLPTDHPRPEIQSYRGSSEVDVLDQEATNGLKELSARYGVTLHMTLLAVYQTLLHRYTSQEELTIGSVLTGRTKSEWAGIFGYFVNSLPLVAQLQGQTLFSQFLSQVRRTVIEALNHQDYPLSTLVGRLGRTRTPGRSPLFDSLFVFQQSPFGTMPELSAFALGLEGTSLNIGGLRVESVPAERQATTSDLTFMVGDSGNGIGISVKYRTDLFEPATVRRMLGHFRTLAKAVSGNPAESILSLPLLTEAERRMILFEWNSNRSRAHSAEPEVVCISDLIEKHANTTPNAPAVVFENDCLTYSQLYDRATCIAAYLRRLGVGPEESVAVCLERGVEIITAIVGIMKAGGAYVPLDPAEPPARITSMLQVVQPRVVLTQNNLLERFENCGLVERCVDIGMCMGEDCKGVAISDWPERHRDSAAYIIFTSGSTGSPRGVCVERRQLLQYVQAISKTMEASPGASYATVTTIAADLGNTMIFPALCTGGCLHIVSSECALSPSSLGEYFSRHEIDFLKIVPSHLETLLKGASATSVLPRKRLILGGESCGWNLVSKVRELAPECMILNHYGPTETTVGVLTHELSDVSIREEHAIVPIGRPLNNIQAYVLDRHLQPVPVGVRGELYIGGDSVTRGYYNLPAITAEKFIPDPFSEVPGSRLYRTGDLARYHVNGIIEFQGRKDQQIKIRGFRIELGEIEEALKRHPSVQQVVVLPVDKANTGKHLVAYIVCHEKSELRPQDLRQFAKQELPEYMVPPAISILANLPLTPNGKIDQKALMEIAPEPCTREAIVEASTPMEKALVAVWKRLLGVEAIGVNDDFFELGGHSLMATQMTSRLEEILPADAPLLVLFFETPTVAGLAEAMQRATSEIGEIERAAETIEEMALSWEL